MSLNARLWASTRDLMGVRPPPARRDSFLKALLHNRPINAKRQYDCNGKCDPLGEFPRIDISARLNPKVCHSAKRDDRYESDEDEFDRCELG